MPAIRCTTDQNPYHAKNSENTESHTPYGLATYAALRFLIKTDDQILVLDLHPAQRKIQL